MPRTLTADAIEDFRARLCDVAEPLFAARGAQGVSMRQIADALGVSAMTPYRYFDSREDILAAVRQRGFERFAEMLEHARENAADSRAARALAAGRAYVDFALANRHVYRLMFDMEQADDGGDGPLGRAIARARRTLTVHGDDLVSGGVAEAQAREAEAVAWATLHGAVMLELAAKLPPGTARRIIDDPASWSRV